MSEVTTCLRERLHRWQQIERLCGFPIIRNPGLANLTAQLYSESVALGLPRVPQSSCSCHSSVHGSLEDLLEEAASPVLPQMPGGRFCFLFGFPLVSSKCSISFRPGNFGAQGLLFTSNHSLSLCDLYGNNCNSNQKSMVQIQLILLC